MATLNRVVTCLSLSILAGLGSAQVFTLAGKKHGQNPPVSSGNWSRLTNQVPNAVGVCLLETDGTVMCQVPNSPAWYRLTPDINGSYQNGTWSAMPSLPSGYSPLYYASAVLPDGRVFVEGGEYNGTDSGVWTNLGAIYNPATNAWTSLNPPSGWSQIGDSQCVLFPDGVSLMIANIYNGQTAILNTSTLAWTMIAGNGKLDRNDEEGWVLLADGTIMTVDAENAGSSPNAERYIPTTQTWIGAGTTPARLEDSGSQELGPMVLRPDGTIFVMGATGANAVYTPPTTLMGSGSWVAAPSFPVISQGQLDVADGPACLLPDGNVLMDASPGIFNSPTDFFEFDGTNLVQVNAPPQASSDTSYLGGMLMLPTGQVLFTDQSNDVEIYTPTGSPQDAWRPTISSVATTLQLSSTNNLLQGTQLNGLSQCTAYGDDATNATNYPLVRIVNGATGHVFYCRTHNHSTMAVATGSATVSTQFDVPAGVETGPSNLYVVANGIQSTPQVINVVAAHVYLPNSVSFVVGSQTGGSLSSLYFTDTSYLTGTIAGNRLAFI